MIFVRRVSGHSMEPRLHSGQLIVCVSGVRCATGEIVVAQTAGREIIKRVAKKQADTYWLLGDNSGHSTDSRDLGWINKSDILGRMIVTFPIAQPAPKLRDKRGTVLGWIGAGIMICFALIHLFRIDTFVPEMTRVVGNTGALWLVSGIVCMEVFALPFLLRMRLSILAQYMSGLFVVVVPLVWLLIAIWTYGTGVSTAQLGEFVNLPSNWLLLLLNLLWLLGSYYAIWALGYDYRRGEKQTFVTRGLARLSKSR